MDSFPIFCGGEFITTDRELPVVNPYSETVFGRTWLAGEKELELAVLASLRAFPVMKHLSSFERSAILSEVAQKITLREDVFASIIAREAAKPLRYALSEVRRAAQTFTVAAEEAKRLPAEYLQLDWTTDTKGREGVVKYFPIGPIAGISPFNFPLNLAVHKIAPALAAGCPIILKPASSTPLSTLELAKILDETALPKGAVSILPMDRNTGNCLVTDERFKLLTFTGSPEVGWKMKQSAGKKKVVLELGGNAGTIIGSTANLEHALNRSLVGGFAYQGQVCIHAQRIFVHQKHYEDFTWKFAE